MFVVGVVNKNANERFLTKMSEKKSQDEHVQLHFQKYLIIEHGKIQETDTVLSSLCFCAYFYFSKKTYYFFTFPEKSRTTTKMEKYLTNVLACISQRFFSFVLTSKRIIVFD